MSTKSSTKACPFCAEQIMAAAVKCRYCGESLEAVEPDSEADAAPAATAPPAHVTPTAPSHAATRPGRSPRAVAVVVIAGIVLLIIGMVSFSTDKSIDPCEVKWKQNKAAYLYQHNVDETDSSAVSDARIGYVDDCKNGLPQ